MNIYHLVHFHGGTEEVDGSQKSLGCFSSLDVVAKAKKFYKTLSGFCLYPYGFCVFEYEVKGESDCNYTSIYLSEIYIRDKLYDFEQTVCLGAFGSHAMAEQCISEFLKQNKQLKKSCDIIVDSFTTKYTLDKMGWQEGFDFD